MRGASLHYGNGQEDSMSNEKTTRHKFLPDDGHVHQYLDGICTWCGAQPADNPLVALAEGAREAGAEITERWFGPPAEAVSGVQEYEPSVTVLTLSMKEMLTQARIFEVEGRPDTIMAFSIRPLEDAQIEHFAKEAQRVLGWAKTLEITDVTSAKTVAGDLRSIAMLRRGVMELMLAKSPESRELRDFAELMGVKETHYPKVTESQRNCILCGMCVLVCEEVIGQSAIGFTGLAIGTMLALLLDKADKSLRGPDDVGSHRCHERG